MFDGFYFQVLGSLMDSRFAFFRTTFSNDPSQHKEISLNFTQAGHVKMLTVSTNRSVSVVP